MKSNLGSIKDEIQDQFLYRIFKVIYNIKDPTIVGITHSESSYNYTTDSLIIKVLAKHLYPKYQTVWFPGEEKLASLFDQLK